jgi:hypothetical protein
MYSGKIINSFSFEENEIKLYGEDDYLVITACADCCSESWFEHMTESIFEQINSEFLKSDTIDKSNLTDESKKGSNDYEFYIPENSKFIEVVGVNGDFDMPRSNRQYCDINEAYKIIYEDEGMRKSAYFILRNSSNGYYNGFYQLHIRKYTDDN